MRSLVELLSIAEEAVEIGRHLMTTSSPGQIRSKGDRDLVTDLDVQIQREIKSYLSRVTPGIDFLGEEQGGGVLNQDADYVWVLDPIDGTSNFAHGIPLCATQLALFNRGEPVVGIIVAPFLNLHYHAIKSLGSFCNGNPIRSSAIADISRAIISVGDYATGPQSEVKNRRRFSVTQSLAKSSERVRMFGSAALDLAFVAEGRTDACVILANNPWDTAAGVLIAREAGAQVVDTAGRRHGPTSPETIAAGAGIIDELRRLSS